MTETSNGKISNSTTSNAANELRLGINEWFTTSDGVPLYCRLIRADDVPRLLDFFEQLSTETRRRRFHMNVDHLPPDAREAHARHFAEVDNVTAGGALVAVDGRSGEETIVGVVRLARPLGQPDSPSAEVALVIRDDFQRRGVGRALLYRLGALAKRMGVQIIIASIEATNHPAITLFRRLPVPKTSQIHHGEFTLQIMLPE